MDCTVEAQDGEAGLRKLSEAVQADDPYRIAVLDMQMPDMNGESLGKTITPCLRNVRFVANGPNDTHLVRRNFPRRLRNGGTRSNDE